MAWEPISRFKGIEGPPKSNDCLRTPQARSLKTFFLASNPNTFRCEYYQGVSVHQTKPGKSKFI